MMRLLFSKPRYIILAGCMVFITALLASGWANTYQRLQEQKMLNKQQVQLARQVSASNQIAIYGLSYALSAEQAKAGKFEADKNGRQEALDKARGYVGGLRYRIGKLEQKLAQCRSTTNMVSDDGWTGQAEIKPKKEDE